MAKGKKVSTQKIALGVGLGLGAVAAAGAGYYFYGSKDAAKNRKKAGAWADTFQADVVKKAKKLKKLDERALKAVIDESMKAYARVKSIDKNDLAAAANELKANWAHIEKEVTRATKSNVTVAKKAVKTAVKKVAKATKVVAKAKPQVKKAPAKAKKVVKKKKQ
jgi:hypothetical protein